MSKPSPITDAMFPATRGKADAVEVSAPVGLFRRAERERNAMLEALRLAVRVTGAAKPAARDLARAKALAEKTIRDVEGGVL